MVAAALEAAALEAAALEAAALEAAAMEAAATEATASQQQRWYLHWRLRKPSNKEKKKSNNQPAMG